ncbi:MAG: carbohydrate binding family 9 domain-containing protein [Gemmatimonadaceae bacterium]|nr:carbohydrate binding family 9 domain-containing protein [Gemmatimonadaceae bacterium]
MLFSLFAGAALQLAAATQPVIHARQGQLTVPAIRVDTTIEVDGRLDEPVWQRAALLTGFSLYAPTDDRPAPDSTEVLIWYSADAMYVGIRAFEPHGEVRATLAERDRLSGDDNVEIHFDTFDERRRALVFIVNPLGIQADGTKSEGGGFIPGSNVAPGQTDLSADFRWQSRGHVTPWGYEVEVRIPFSSMRYPVGMPQQWGIQVVRRVQHSGYEQTWTPARRASASFIAQAGTLTGLTGMRHGQVVELNPELTSTVMGAECCAEAPGDWRYTRAAQLGGNVRWAMGSNFVVNGTVKPDFSQVEADAAQIAADPRFALFYPERRPFFVEGSDQFNVPNTLVYTRRIVQPEAAAKITGKLGRTDVAVLTAVDDRATTTDGTRPLVNIARLSRGIGGQSTAGVLYSGRTSGLRDNHVAGADAKIVFGRLYFAQLQAVQSSTTAEGATRSAPMWELLADRTGRAWGFNYRLTGVGEGFQTDNGFVPRTGYVEPAFMNRLTAYGTPGGLFERYNVFIQTRGLWRYDDFFDGRSMLENRFSLGNSVTLRGGWSIGFSPAIGTFAFDAADYRNLWNASPGDPEATPFDPSDRIPVAGSGFSVSTPQYQRFSASASASLGNDVDFRETSRVRRQDYHASVNLRPSDRLRVQATYGSTSLRRRSDGEQTLSTRIPRLRVEYQIARPIFVRVVSQYESVARAALRDPRTGEILYVGTGPGAFALSQPRASNALRADWLFSYRPSPGAVFFAGYGNTLAEPGALAFRDLTRVNDAFFLKASYVFRP